MSDFGGGPRVQQALAAGSIDIAIGSGPELALIAKGAPEIGIAAMADAPYAVVLAVPQGAPGQDRRRSQGQDHQRIEPRLADLLAGAGAVAPAGLGPGRVQSAPLGTTAAQMAALKTRQIDGMIVEVNAGYRLEEEGSGRVLVQFGDLIKTFHIYVLYARKTSRRRTRKRCGLSRRLVRDHRLDAEEPDKTIEIVRRTADVSPGIATRDYDELMGMFKRTGRFNPEALNVLARSFVEMGMLPKEPDMRKAHHRAVSAGAHEKVSGSESRSAPSPRLFCGETGPPRLADRISLILTLYLIAAGVPGGSGRGSTSTTPWAMRTR